MPYKIEKRGAKKYAVVKATGSSKPLGTHDSIVSAQQQIRAIYANEKKRSAV